MIAFLAEFATAVILSGGSGARFTAAQLAGAGARQRADALDRARILR
jgi:hypothetical protein